MTLFTEQDYAALHRIVFRGDYPGYRPAVVESPNGDTKLDEGKKFAHIATKYLATYKDGWDRSVLLHHLHMAHNRACEVAVQSGLVPEAFLPSFEHGALRVLEYPPMASSAYHTDFDLFTLNLYRNVPNMGLGQDPVHMGELGELIGLGSARGHQVFGQCNVQHSLVYFAIPAPFSVLPDGRTVGTWLNERITRSRYDR